MSTSGCALGGVLLAAALGCRQQPQTWARESHLTRSLERDVPVTSARRDEPGSVYFVVALADAPVGGRLELQCAWRSPSGKLARENAFETRRITRPDWPTHCKMAISRETEAGRWSVAMLRDQATLATAELRVE